MDPADRRLYERQEAAIAQLEEERHLRPWRTLEELDWLLAAPRVVPRSYRKPPPSCGNSPPFFGFIPELNNSETVSPKIVKSETVFSKTVNLGGKNAKPTLDKSLFAFSFASLCSCKGKEAKEKHPPAPVPTPRVGVAGVQSAPAPVLVPRVRSAMTQLTSAPIPTPRVGVAGVQSAPAPVLVPRVRSATTQLTSAPIPTPRVGVASVRQVPAPVPVFCWRLWRAGPAPVLVS
uniref:Uncharacterized protein n=1 Tax=Haplochromis burtoni TaxID=8153 RepID=A0A3Q2VAM2_HAPBU